MTGRIRTCAWNTRTENRRGPPREPGRFITLANADVTFEHVLAAAERLEGVAHRTPVMTSRTLDEAAGCRVFLKCENFQRVGAFKFRGAYNTLSALSAEEKTRGVIT